MSAATTSRISASFNTKERLLDAAEELFAQNGISGTSLRDLTNKAAANLASVNYHFGSKDGLLRALLERRIKPLNDERMRLLDLAERAAGDGVPTLESILHAFVAPTIWSCRQHPHFMRVMGRMQTDPDPAVRQWMASDLFATLVSRLERLLTRRLPDVPVAELYWRMCFLVGSMCHTWMNLHDVELCSKGQASFDGDNDMIERLVCFGAAGLRAGVCAPMSPGSAGPRTEVGSGDTQRLPRVDAGSASATMTDTRRHSLTPFGGALEVQRVPNGDSATTG